MKTMKKVLALVLVMALTAVAAVNLTLAYLQDQDEAVNVMTLGNVYIDQIEQERGEDGALNEFTQDKPLYPAVGELVKEGDYWTANNVVDKIVSVKNTGESSAYVRTIFAFEKASGMADLVHKNINDTDWTWEKDVIEINIDGVTYTVWVATYPQALAIGATTPASLIQVALDKTADNDYVNALGEYDILVVSQAIQTMGFENVGAQAALVEGFGPITTDNHPWLNGIIGERWDGSADPEGLVPSENDPNLYEIYTPAQLKAFADSVNGTAASTFSLRASNVGNTYAGCTVKLMADIDLNNMAWTPIGPNADASNKFAGTFDGQGHTISNLKVVTEPGYTAAGLFGSLNGTAKNFTIKNATISHISTGAATDNGIAVVAGSIYNRGAIDNVHVVNATVTGNRYVGGISGYTYGSVTNCSVKNVKLVATPDNQGGSYDNGDKVGGIAGYFASETVYSISGNTVTDATIQAYRDFGGVVGCANGADKVTGNTVSGLILIQDDTNGYKNETITTYGEIVGRITGGELDGSNNADVAIEAAGDNADLKAAVNEAQSGDTIYLGANEFTMPSLADKDGLTIVGTEGTVVGGEEATTGFGGNFGKNTTIQNVTFSGATNGVRYSYAKGGVSTFDNCTFAGDSTYGFHIDESNGATFIFNNCTFVGFNAFAGDLEKVVFNNCTFESNGNYGHTNIWSKGYFNDCTWGEGATYGTRGSGKVYINNTLESDSAEAIAESLAEGENVVLTDDVSTEANTTAPYGNNYGVALNGGVLDGNGNELAIECYGDDYGIMTSGGTVKNLTIKEGCRAVMIMYPTEDIILDNVNIGGDGVLYPINTGEAGAEGVNLIVTNSVLAGWTSFGNIESASFTNVEFKQGTYYNNIYGRVLKPYVNTTLTNCKFVEHMNLDLSALTEGHKVTIENCTVNGQTVTADVFTIPSTDEEYDTELFTVDLPSWASSVTDCVIFK